jgi:RNA 2',3'-cyclic 3'-phosphodiesterase
MKLLYDTADVAEHAIDPVTWTVAEFWLVHSLLEQTRHVTLDNLRLGETQAS